MITKDMLTEHDIRRFKENLYHHRSGCVTVPGLDADEVVITLKSGEPVIEMVSVMHLIAYCGSGPSGSMYRLCGTPGCCNMEHYSDSDDCKIDCQPDQIVVIPPKRSEPWGQMRGGVLRDRDIERFSTGFKESESGCLTVPGIKGSTARIRLEGHTDWVTRQIARITVAAQLGAEPEGLMFKHCSTPGCCNLDHYGRAKRERGGYMHRKFPTKRETELEYFEDHSVLHEHSGCIIWTGEPYRDTRTNRPTFTAKWKGRRQTVGRIAWQIAHGEIAPGRKVYRMCGNIRCVNPDHLELR